MPVRAASVDLAQLDAMERDALDAIDHVTDPESAERLLAQVKAVHEAQRLARLGAEYERRWGRVRLLAERRYGELLGPAMPGRPEIVTSGHITERLDNRATWKLKYDAPADAADRKARERARVVASVPESTFTEYVDNEPAPSRAGLLRAADKLAPLMSSKTDMWATPQDLFDQLHAEFGFDLDVCATAENAKCAAFYDQAVDGLAQPWTGTCWMNPPYGEVIGTWVGKARLSAEKGATVVCLVPARVDTNWWWGNCIYGEIRFLRGRLKFGGAETSAPFPSAVVIFGPNVTPTVKWWER